MLTSTIRSIGVLLAAGALLGCGSGGTHRPDGGTHTPPTGALVTERTTLPALSNATSGMSTMLTATGACAAASVGRCGCLEPEDWYIDANNTVYDVVCCTAAGDAYTLYSCGNAAVCDDDEGHVVCE